jgi:hypothetical protein
MMEVSSFATFLRYHELDYELGDYASTNFHKH